MPRVIAGRAKGRRIAVPPGGSIRPTGDRVREALFASIVSDLGDLTGLRLLDLFAGSGAVGLEALSRGAAHVLLVESGQKAARALRANVASIGLAGARVEVDTAERVVSRGPIGSPYHCAFADPPYALPDTRLTALLRGLVDAGWLASGALVAVERAARSVAVDWPDGIEHDRVKRYGDTALWYGLAAGSRDLWG